MKKRRGERKVCSRKLRYKEQGVVCGRRQEASGCGSGLWCEAAVALGEDYGRKTSVRGLWYLKKV